MVKQAGFLAENLVGIAVGLGIVVILVSLWVADASRRTQEIEGMIERADLDAATFYLPLVVVPAQWSRRRLSCRRFMSPKFIPSLRRH